MKTFIAGVLFIIGVTSVSDAIGMNTTTCDVGVACDSCPQSLVFEHTNKRDRVCCKNCATTAIEYGSVPSDWCICRSSNTKMPDSVKLPLSALQSGGLPPPPPLPHPGRTSRRVDPQSGGGHGGHGSMGNNERGPMSGSILEYEFVDANGGARANGDNGGASTATAERRFGAMTAERGGRQGYGPTFYPASAGISSSGRDDRPGGRGSVLPPPHLLLSDSKSANLRAPPAFGSSPVDISSVRLLKDVADDLYGAFAHVMERMKEMEKMHDEMSRLEERVYRLENDVGRNYNSLDRSDQRRPPSGRDSLLGREGLDAGGISENADYNCPRGFQAIPRLRSCFHFAADRLLDWYGAQTNCMRMDPRSHLAEFDGVAEYDEVIRFMDKKNENSRQTSGRRGEFHWIGAKRELRDYLWETTQKIVDPSFDRKIENGYTSFSGSRSCLAVTRADSRAEYRLEGITCANPSGYICMIKM